MASEFAKTAEMLRVTISMNKKEVNWLIDSFSDFY